MLQAFQLEGFDEIEEDGKTAVGEPKPLARLPLRRAEAMNTASVAVDARSPILRQDR